MHVAEQALWNTRVRMYALGFNLMQTMAETKKHQQVLGMAAVANFERIARKPLNKNVPEVPGCGVARQVCQNIVF